MLRLMKYIFTILLLVTMYPGLAQARVHLGGGEPRQNNPNKQRKFDRSLKEAKMANRLDKLIRAQEYKEAFIKAKLSLTADQNEKFLPLFRQYQSELLNAQLEMRAVKQNPQANGLDQADKEEAISIKIINIRRHYRAEFSKVIPPEKVALISKYEQEFNDEALRQLREKREEANN
jgi:hypothetical protein